jgi:hypothetical protein
MDELVLAALADCEGGECVKLFNVAHGYSYFFDPSSPATQIVSTTDCDAALQMGFAQKPEEGKFLVVKSFSKNVDGTFDIELYDALVAHDVVVRHFLPMFSKNVQTLNFCKTMENNVMVSSKEWKQFVAGLFVMSQNGASDTWSHSQTQSKGK